MEFSELSAINNRVGCEPVPFRTTPLKKAGLNFISEEIELIELKVLIGTQWSFQSKDVFIKAGDAVFVRGDSLTKGNWVKSSLFVLDGKQILMVPINEIVLIKSPPQFVTGTMLDGPNIWTPPVGMPGLTLTSPNITIGDGVPSTVFIGKDEAINSR